MSDEDLFGPHSFIFVEERKIGVHNIPKGEKHEFTNWILDLIIYNLKKASEFKPENLSQYNGIYLYPLLHVDYN